MINAVTIVVGQNNNKTEIKLDGNLDILTHELAAICASVYGIAQKQGKAEEFSETDLKVMELVNKPTNSCYHKPVCENLL